ncbi:MAG: hypothetical protein ACW97A_12085 [Candidatus Thorarchaeota archaeon]|jgi:hypothetical protein
MNRKNQGSLLVLVGLASFFSSLFLILPLPGFYLLSLIIMFGGVILVGVGSAIARGFDNSLDSPRSECYYCNGSGKHTIGEEEELCPRCGGTGFARQDD